MLSEPYRTFAQLVVYELLSQFPDLFDLETDPYVASLYRFLQNNPDLQRLRGSMGAALSAFCPDKATSPSGIFVRGTQLVGPLGTCHEGAAPALMDMVVEFLAAARKAASTESSSATAKGGPHSCLFGTYKLYEHFSVPLLGPFQHWMLLMAFPLLKSVIGSQETLG